MLYNNENYETLDPLNNPLKPYDDVVFHMENIELIYKVREDYLECLNCSNDAIFMYLELDRYAFCSEHYGFSTCEGNWPFFHHKNYCEATNCVIALFDIVTNNAKDVKKLELSDICCGQIQILLQNPE